MIPSPNLDDRTYKEIVDEAIRLIPHYCPEWTNHNPTDPGITMIELFSWMTEMIIYRLNKVPEKTYLTLLDLVGLSFMPPQSSKALLSFTPVEGYSGNIRIKRSTQLSTTKSEATGSIVFETEKDLVVKNINLEACFGTNNGLITDNLIIDERSTRGFPLFSGENEIDRFIYFTDPMIGFLVDTNVLNITFNCANEIKSLDDEVVNFLEWQYWNGDKWIPIEPQRTLPGINKEDNEIYFSGPLNIVETEINGKEGFYIRASLVSYPDRQKCFELNEVLMNLLFYGEGLNPDLCICNTENMVFHTIDVSKDFKPYVDVPKYNDSFYIASDEVFSKEDSEIQINFYLSDDVEVDKPEMNKNLLLRFEYWNGKNWMGLGDTTMVGVHNPEGEFKFLDTSNALSKNGIVKFKRPGDFKAAIINGQEHHWVRIRIGAGDFGKGGQHIRTEDGKWVWVYDKPVRPPMLSRIKLFYIAAKKPPVDLTVYNEFSYVDFTKNIVKNFAIDEEKASDKNYFTIFNINKEKSPITYFGFNTPFPPGDAGIYFRLNERRKVKPGAEVLPGIGKIGIRSPRADRAVTLQWEYWDGKGWKNLSVNDYTDSFHESGFVEFKCPEDLTEKSEFGKNLFWIRLIFEAGSFEVPPRVLNILLNSVYGFNHQTYRNEILGSSTGAPSQKFEIFRSPVLPGLKLMVKENCLPPANEREEITGEEGEDAISKVKNSSGKEDIWIRYHERENFYASKATSRHYCVDYINNLVLFGDGTRGMIPPRVKNNIRIIEYTTGGGVSGNVGSHTITILRENIPYVAGVVNYYPAEGGSNLEDMESLKNRASNVFKNLNRAVTAEDYEWLAMEASTSVARSKCLSKCGKNGEVIVVVVPRPDSDDFDMKEKLQPSSELLRRVKEFLNVRKLVGTKLRVEPPSYKNITINLKIVFKKDVSEIQIIKEQVEHYIRRAFHPITGGLNGTGWAFGMPLAKNEIFNILEKVDGIYYIEEIELYDNDVSSVVEKLMLAEDCLIHVDKVVIHDRKYLY